MDGGGMSLEGFKVNWVVWMELALGVLRPDLLAKVKILG